MGLTTLSNPFSASTAFDNVVWSALEQSTVIGFGHIAAPDFICSLPGNAAEKFPPAGGMGDWGLPQQAVFWHQNAMLAPAPPQAAGTFNDVSNYDSIGRFLPCSMSLWQRRLFALIGRLFHFTGFRMNQLQGCFYYSVHIKYGRSQMSCRPFRLRMDSFPPMIMV